MTSWLVDTNVVSELRRSLPAGLVLEFFAEQPLETLYISAVTLSEFRYGTSCVADPEKRTALHAWIDEFVRPMFKNRVLLIDEDVMLVWRLMLAEGRRTNYTFPQPDLILAATAAHHGMTVVTRDQKVFERAGVRVFNPWKA